MSVVFTLNLEDKFQRLSKPPIVEATIHWQAMAGKPFNLESIVPELKRHFAKYPNIERIMEVKLSAIVSPSGDSSTAQQARFNGFQITSEDGKEIVRLFRDSVTYSLVKSYTHWDSFRAAAEEVWAGFTHLAAPNEIHHLGVRFINHFPTVTPGTLKDVLKEPPTCPMNLPLKEFVYQSGFDVPGHNYGVRIIKVMQPPGLPDSSGLFLDIDVSTTKVIPNEATAMDTTLKYLRWLKNKVFFSLLTDASIQELI